MLSPAIYQTYTLMTQVKGQTYHKTKEEQLQAEVENLYGILELFTYSTSHDLRSPIATVEGLINLIEMEEDPSKVKHYVSLIKQSVYKQDYLLQNITDLLKNERMPLKNTLVDVRQLVEEVLSDLDFLDPREEIEKIIYIAPQAPVCLDRIRLKTILHNLLSNALKFQHTDKREKHVIVGVESNPQHIILSIEDNGIGIKNENREQVFDMFYRATSHNHGAGLGLYIARRTVQKMGGNIRFCERQQRGIRVLIELPNQLF